MGQKGGTSTREGALAGKRLNMVSVVKGKFGEVPDVVISSGEAPNRGKMCLR